MKFLIYRGFVIYSSIMAFLVPGILLAVLQSAIFIRKRANHKKFFKVFIQRRATIMFQMLTKSGQKFIA
jgi:hypothetical protein